MSYEWQRQNGMPDFTRTGQDGASGGGRLVWLLVVLALLGGAVLFSAFSTVTPAERDNGAAAPAAATGTTD